MPEDGYSKKTDSKNAFMDERGQSATACRRWKNLENNLVARRLIDSDRLRWLHNNHVWIICCCNNLLISIWYNMHRLAVYQYSLRLRDSRHSDWCHLVASNWPLLTSSQIFIQFGVKKAKNNSIENWKCEKGTKMGQSIFAGRNLALVWPSTGGSTATTISYDGKCQEERKI